MIYISEKLIKKVGEKRAAEIALKYHKTKSAKGLGVTIDVLEDGAFIHLPNEMNLFGNKKGYILFNLTK